MTVGGAIAALEAREIIYGAVALAGSLFGVAVLFFFLDAEFVAVFQIIVYIGAVAILILFTVMLVRQEKWMKDAAYLSVQRLAGTITAVAVAASLVLAFADADFSAVVPQGTAPDFLGIGMLIGTQFSPALEVLALVLAAAVLGAVALVRVDRGRRAD